MPAMPSADPPSERAHFEMSQWRPRRSRRVLVGLVALLVGAVGLVLWLARRPRVRHHRWLVAIQTRTRDGVSGAWWAKEGQASGRCADRLAERLRPLGVEVVGAAEPEVREALAGVSTTAELREAARRLGAAVVLDATFRVDAARPLTGSNGQVDFALALTGALASAAGDQVEPLGEAPLRIHRAAASEAAALLDGCEALAERLPTLIAQAATKLPSLAPLLGTGRQGLRLDQEVSAERLAPLRDLAIRYEAARRLRREAERRLQEQDARLERGDLGKKLLSAFGGEEYLVGPGPGSTVVTMVLPTWLAVDDTSQTGYRMRAEHEQLLQRGPDGTTQRVLTELFNIYSFPSITADGATVALVADHRRWSKALQLLDVSSGAVAEIAWHRSDYFSSPVIAPDGHCVVFGYGSSRHSPRRLEVIGSDGRGRRVLVAGPLLRMDRPAWSPDSTNLYVAHQAAGESGSSLWRIDVAAHEAIPLLGPATRLAGEGEADGRTEIDADADGQAESPSVVSFLAPVMAPDGTFVALVESAGSETWLGRYDVADGSYHRLVRAPVGRIAVAPDSKRIAFETGPTDEPNDPLASDTEIAMVAMDGGKMSFLTLNGTRDGLAGWSRDGRRLYLHQGNRDPDGRRYDNRVVWLEP